uniref:Uncharacterized protein n=1 Tax=Rhizophora mucronata TaxID=61149 RepID=A0A2P2PFU0_RHIMU
MVHVSYNSSIVCGSYQKKNDSDRRNGSHGPPPDEEREAGVAESE